MSDNPLLTAQQAFNERIPKGNQKATKIELSESLGRILATDVKAPMASPPYSRAIVEGFLVNTAETELAGDDKKITFTIKGSVNPGDERCPVVESGCAVQVATGSVVPDGNYSIVRMWEAEQEGETITISRPFPPRFFIEEEGCDVKNGSVIAVKGETVTPALIGTIASMGITHVEVSKRLKITIFSSGDEVIAHTAPFKVGAIYDSNSIMLSAAVLEAGSLPEFGGIMQDDFDKFVSTLKIALTNSDMVVISGGTAVGGRDFISDLLREVGECVVDGVPMRSGRPLIMGVASGKPVVCVAGHPPEALRGFKLFGVMAINKLLGRDLPIPEDA